MECFSCTQFAALVPRFTAGISALSSSMIIYIIFRSKAGLTTIYHRIMFGMSTSDILSSIAIGLTTLPMPKELPFDSPFFEGTRLGNSETCKAQGFFFTFGNMTMFSYNGMLFLYYTCAIVFQMTEDQIVRYVESVLHLFPLTFSLVIAILSLVNEMYNVTQWAAWCMISKHDNVIGVVIASAFLSFVLIGISLIVLKVMKLEKAILVHTTTDGQNSQSSDSQETSESLQNTKVIGIQAIAYFSSFMMTIGICVILKRLLENPKWLNYVSAVLVPSQGFFNFFIFISQKVYNYRRVHSNFNKCDVIRLLLRGNAEEPILISRISFIQKCYGDESDVIKISDEYKSEAMNVEKISVCGVENDDVSNFRDDKLSEFELSVAPKFIDEESADRDLSDSRSQMESNKSLYLIEIQS